MIDTTYLPATSHHHGSGSGFGGAVERGAGWGLGRDLERTLFHLLPVWLVVIIALAGAAFLAYRWWSNAKAPDKR